MKKVLLFVFGMVMIISMVGGAAGLITQDQGEQQAQVTLVVKTDYEITIPSVFQIDKDSGLGDGTITCTVRSIPFDKNLTLTVSSDDNFGQDTQHPGSWALKHEAGGQSDYVGYLIGVSDNYNDHASVDTNRISNGDTVIDIPSAPENGQPIHVYLHFRLQGNPTITTTYTDTLTFEAGFTDKE